MVVAVLRLEAAPLAGAVDQRLMDTTFSPLAEGFRALVNFALEWLLSGVSEVMFHQVLLQGKVLSTLVTNPLLVNLVDLHVPLQTILCLEDLAATQDVTPEPFIVLLIILGHF